jgi:hypothetical protein
MCCKLAVLKAYFDKLNIIKEKVERKRSEMKRQKQKCNSIELRSQYQLRNSLGAF